MKPDPNRSRKGIRLLCPEKFCHNGVLDISPSELRSQGVEAVLVDLDNTLVGWQRSDVSGAVKDWLQELKKQGLKLCLVSNTRHGERLIRLSAELDIPYVKRAWKPRKKGFEDAMKELGVSPENTIMVGDQMFTDVLGGNRVGVRTMMVRPMNRKEFFGTKISRAAEVVILTYLRRRGWLQ